jgi:hypothetical protein
MTRLPRLFAEVQHVDREARDRAAELLRAYLVGELPGGRLVEDWPDAPDRALDGMAAEILHEIRGGRIDEEYTDETRDDMRCVLERCERFLRTDLPYGWGKVGRGGCITYGCVTVALIVATGAVFASLSWGWLGLVLMLLTLLVALLSAPARGMTAQRDPEKIELMVCGELWHWPFESEEDMWAVMDGRDPSAADNEDPPDRLAFDPREGGR